MSKKEDIVEQIGEINLKIVAANKELDEIELKYRRKKLEIRKYKNEMAGLKLELQELDLENCKEIQKQNKIKQIEKARMKKYTDFNNEYYSQEKKEERFLSTEDPYINYMEKNRLPYLE